MLAEYVRAAGGSRHVLVEEQDSAQSRPWQTIPGLLFVGWYHTKPGRDDHTRRHHK